MHEFLNKLPESVAFTVVGVTEHYLTDFRRKHAGKAMAVLRPRSTEKSARSLRGMGNCGLCRPKIQESLTFPAREA